MAETGKTKKILIAEDEVSMREIIVFQLTSHGYEVVEAENGTVALEKIEKEHPDLLLLDLMMPETDGFEVLEKVRANPDKKISEIPVIIISNLWSNEDILRIKHLKISAYMVKAYFTTKEILNKVTEVLQHKNTL